MNATTTTADTQRPPIPQYDFEPPRTLLSRASRAWKRWKADRSDRREATADKQKTHVVICGFPRSGTTLLMLIVEACVDDIHVFGKETRAISVARFIRSDHRFLISKRTNDVYWVEEIRDYYAQRPTEVRFILSMRDPRDVLTSHHASRPGEYYVPTERWQAIYDHLCFVRNTYDEAQVFRYEDLVADPQAAARRLQEFLAWEWKRPIESFHEAVPDNFDMVALNGLRPMDPTRAGRWKGDEHRQRIEQILREIPELPQYLIDEGYETDTAWATAYGYSA